MKYIFRILIVLTLSSFCSTSQAQRIMGALIGGGNLTNVQGDDVFGFRKPGLNAGAAAIVPFGEKWSVSLETIYSQKGSNHKEGGRGMDYQERHDYNQYKLVLNYVEIPLLVHYIDREWLRVGAGFSYGRLVEVKEWEDNVRIATTTLNEGPYSLNDYSGLLDIQIPVYQQLRFNFRYTFSLAHIRERVYQNVVAGEEKIRKQYNQVLSFRLMWVFNEKSSKYSRRR
jgi:hypothetical protein